MTAAPAISEAEWQEQVVELAHHLGWRHLHVRRTIGKGHKWVTSTNVKGWPDLFMWHTGAQRTMAVELKAEKGQLSPEQVDVLADLEAAGVETHVWRPSDLEEAAAALNTRA